MNLGSCKELCAELPQGTITGDLYVYVIVGPDSQTGFARHLTGEELQDMVDAFFESAMRGQQNTDTFVHNLKTHHTITLFNDLSPQEHFNLLNRALHRTGLKREHIPDIQAGFRGILSKDPEITEEQKQLAQKFTRGLFPSW